MTSEKSDPGTQEAVTCLSLDELRAVSRFAASCAKFVLPIFETAYPKDLRPRFAIEAAESFAEGLNRTTSLRNSAWAANKAATEARDHGQAAASEASRAARAAAAAAFLHPICQASQVKHILGSAGHALRALELNVRDDQCEGTDCEAALACLATPLLVSVLCRYPTAPESGGRVGEIIRHLDSVLRSR